MDEGEQRSQRHVRRTVSMLGACLATTSAGTVYLFSTYGPALSHRLGLSSSQSNVVAISANYGLLLSGPLFGWAADTIGPRVLSLIAAVGSFTAFTALAYTYSGAWQMPSWLILSLYMVLVGLSAQSANMAAVTTTTKNFKQNRGSAVSLCIAFFGLSPFVLSHVNTVFFAGDEPDTFGYLRFLSFLGLVTSVAAAGCLTVVGFGPSRYASVPPGFVVDRPPSSSSSSGLLSERDDESVYGAVKAASTAVREVGEGSAGSSTTAEPGPVVLTSNGVDYDTARDLGGWAYVNDVEARLLMLVLFLCAGIGISYNNNIGTMVNAMYYSSTPHPEARTAQRLLNHHVAVVSLGSFVGRLTIGVVADMCKRMWRLPRSGILVVITACVLVSQLVVISATTLPSLLVGSACTGLSYGFTFGFVPTLVSVWFGTRHFGANWGVTTVFTGFSGQMLGAVFGRVYDANLPDRDPAQCPQGSCYRAAFWLAVAVAVGSVVAAAVLAKRRARRRRDNRRRWEAEEIEHVEYVPFVLAE